MIQKIFCTLLVVLSMFTDIFALPQKNDVTPEKFQVSTYIIADRVQDIKALHSEDFDIITDAILFGCATFDEEGKLTVNDEVLRTAIANIKKVSKSKDITITLNILGPSGKHNDDWNKQMRNLSAAHNKAFNSGNLEKNIADTVEKYGLDGIHFDYEYPINAHAWVVFNTFLIGLRKVMPDKIIGISVADWNANLCKKSIEAIDYVELMLYDNYGEDGRHSTFDISVENANNRKLRNIPHNKAHFGLPFYARPTDHDAYWYSYCDFYDKLDDNGFYKDEKIGKDFWFNTPDVISKKTQYAIDNNYGGVMIWHYSCDMASSDPNSLLKAIGDTINK